MLPPVIRATPRYLFLTIGARAGASGRIYLRRLDVSGSIQIRPLSRAPCILADRSFWCLRTATVFVNSRRLSQSPSPMFRWDLPPLLVIYAVSEQGAFTSKDGGKTWRQSSLPGKGAKVRAVATSFRHGNIAYVSYSDLSLDGKKWMGVAKTENAGESWQLVWKESGSAAQNVHDAWITARFGYGWGENPLELTVADQDPNLAYATDLGRTMKTSDGGKSWWAMYSRKASSGEWTSTGLDVTNVYGIHFDPFDTNRQFLTYTDIGLFRSEDGGAGWQSSTAGVPREWLNTTYWVVFDPKVRGRMWSVNSYTHDLPRPKMWRHTDPSKFKGGVCLSDDGGKTWRKSNTGMDETAATHILLDPNSPTDARVLYVAGFGRGVYKSSDGGKSWTLKNQGITQKQPFAWRLSQASDGTLYVVIARRSEDGSIGNAYDGAIYRSKDGAEHWESVSLPSGVNGPNALSPDPKSPERLYLAAWARASGTHGDGGGIFLSENGGQSWRQVFDGDRHVYDVTFDPHDANVVYASGFESSAWRSSDRGEHWSRIPGFNFKWGYRVIPDPVDRKQDLYINIWWQSLAWFITRARRAGRYSHSQAAAGKNGALMRALVLVQEMENE